MTGFDTAERLAIVEEWQRQAAAWKPRDGHTTGCLMMLAALVLLVGVPKLGQLVSIPKPVSWLALALTAFLGIGGFIVRQSRVLPASIAQITDDAVAVLSSGSADARARRHAAVALLFHAWDHHGPTLSRGYDHAAAAQRTGSELAYVQSVEQVLRDELKIASVFTP